MLILLLYFGNYRLLILVRLHKYSRHRHEYLSILVPCLWSTDITNQMLDIDASNTSPIGDSLAKAAPISSSIKVTRIKSHMTAHITAGFIGIPVQYKQYFYLPNLK
jgi:hypothetical protein